MSIVEEISVEDLKARMDNGEKFRLIDVRSDAEYNQGIIEGGEFLPLHLLPMHMNSFSNDENIIFYCRTGARSAQACMYVKQNADVDALNLAGGIVRWYQTGYPITPAKAA